MQEVEILYRYDELCSSVIPQSEATLKLGTAQSSLCKIFKCHVEGWCCGRSKKEAQRKVRED